jgi:hypothetical protein
MGASACAPEGGRRYPVRMDWMYGGLFLGIIAGMIGAAIWSRWKR